MKLKCLTLTNKIPFFVAVIASFFFVGQAQAARIFTEINSTQEAEKVVYEVSAFLDTEGESLNVVAGEMHYSPDELSFVKVLSGGTIVSLWLTSPIESSAGVINFTGGVTNGYNGERGYLFSAFFSSADNLSVEDVSIIFENTKVYVNDGKGTEKKLTDASNLLNLKNAEIRMILDDKEPPEIFAPYVTNDANLEGGKWVVLFYAQDKGSGIDYYGVFESVKRYAVGEIAADRQIDWKKVKGGALAYTLEDQKLEKYIYVKAVDRAGNTRVVEVVPAKSQVVETTFGKLFIFAIILIIAESILFIRARRRKKRAKKINQIS